MAGTVEKGGEKRLLSSVPGARAANQNSVLAALWNSGQAMAETFPLGLTPRIPRRLLLG